MIKDVAIVTGANAGLGYQVALHLARHNYQVIMACRNLEKANKAAEDILIEVPGADIIVETLDVSEPSSIKVFTEWFSARFNRLDLLINNAGVAAIPLARNSIGHEMQLATNYLGAFALTGRLMPLLAKGIRPRVVNVNSLAHRIAKLGLDDFNWEKKRYDAWQSYNRSKLALIIFTLELERRLRISNSKIIAVGAHPGFAATAILDNSPFAQPKGPLGKWLKGKIYEFFPGPAQGSLPIIHAATAELVQGADYFGPKGLFEIAGKRVDKADINLAANNSRVAHRLWALSESMAGVRFL